MKCLLLLSVMAVCLAAHAQELPDAPSAKTSEPPRIVNTPRRNPFKVLYDIHRHPQRTPVIWMIGAGVAGGMIAWFTREHCDHYPLGENGVGVDCPAEYKK